MGIDICCLKDKSDWLCHPKAWYVLEPLILEYFGLDKEKDKSKYRYGYSPKFTEQQAKGLKEFLLKNKSKCQDLYLNSKYNYRDFDLTIDILSTDFEMFIDFLENCEGFGIY